MVSFLGVSVDNGWCGHGLGHALLSKGQAFFKRQACHPSVEEEYSVGPKSSFSFSSDEIRKVTMAWARISFRERDPAMKSSVPSPSHSDGSDHGQLPPVSVETGGGGDLISPSLLQNGQAVLERRDGRCLLEKKRGRATTLYPLLFRTELVGGHG